MSPPTPGLWLHPFSLSLFQSLFSWPGASLAGPPLRCSTKENASVEFGTCCTEGVPPHTVQTGPEGLREPRAPKGTSPQSLFPLEPIPSPPAPPGPPHPADTEESEPVSSHMVLFPAASQGPCRNDLLPDPQAERISHASSSGGVWFSQPCFYSGEAGESSRPAAPSPPTPRLWTSPFSNLQPSTLGIRLLNATSAPRGSPTPYLAHPSARAAAAHLLPVLPGL